MKHLQKTIIPENLIEVHNTGFKPEDSEPQETIAERMKLRRQTDVPALESEELYAQRKDQTGKGLKTLKSNNMLSRLPITLAQLQARNNSQKLKNEIRQLVYSLYCSEKILKAIYSSLINHI